MRGLTELTRSQIIARTIRRGHYFINPNFVFNGDRIAFTTLIERDEQYNEDQQELEIWTQNLTMNTADYLQPV